MGLNMGDSNASGGKGKRGRRFLWVDYALMENYLLRPTPQKQVPRLRWGWQVLNCENYLLTLLR